uniref:SEFIR domain-containing protein n=1 Tax=Neolamprologus brichardi TaxID=32507 RepID=A0A3Q4M5E7_NEOBR
MMALGWSFWCILLSLHMPVHGLEIFEHDSHKVICSKGLSKCKMKDEMPVNPSKNTVDVQTLKPDFKLCCTNKTACALCLVIDIEFNIDPDEDTEDQGSSGSEMEEYREDKITSQGSLTVCYCTDASMPECKKVVFTVNHEALTQQNQLKISVVITQSDGFPFEISLIVRSSSITERVAAPSFNEATAYYASGNINSKMNQVELQLEDGNKIPPSMCIQYEQKGRCQSWNRMTLPLYSVTRCMCLQLWYEDGQRSTRSLQCPFNSLHESQKNIWENITVSKPHVQMTSFGEMLSWNVSAPCRLDGKVWLLKKHSRSRSAFSQQLENGTAWKQNIKGLWVNTFVFENVPLRPLPCLMVKVKGMEHDLGPFCFDNNGRYMSHFKNCKRIAFFYFLKRDFIFFYWQHGGIVKIGKMRHVVLLSPPDVDDATSKLVCHIGSNLSDKGFSVSVDQWSRREQCNWGPLPWLHSQLLELNSLGGRVLLVLTRRALERTEEWMHWNKDIINESMGNKENDLPKLWSPYSDLFTASLSLIQADKLLDRAGKRFVLVKFDSHPRETHTRDRCLPELLQGLPLFSLPSQTQSLLAELTVTKTERGSYGGSSIAEIQVKPVKSLKLLAQTPRKKLTFRVSSIFLTRTLMKLETSKY